MVERFFKFQKMVVEFWDWQNQLDFGKVILTVRLSSRGIYNCSFLVTWVEMDISKGVNFSKAYRDHASSLELKSNNLKFAYFAKTV